MPGLLVSVRSPAEARDAVAGGAAIVDVKEPRRGPLGRADARVWTDVRWTVPPEIPISVALGELSEFSEASPRRISVDDLEGIAYCKVGMAGAHDDWPERWEHLRAALGPGPSWVAVIYSDWVEASAPSPDTLLKVALAVPACSGVLIDTWGKARSSPLDESWIRVVERIRESRRFVTLAGGLDEAAISRLASLAPDYFAVRGAACAEGNRLGRVERARVARLRRAVDGQLR